jgi:hypothetical protein
MTKASSILPRKPIKNSLLETKYRCVDASAMFLKRYPNISAWKAATIYNINPSSINKRLLGQIRPQEISARDKQSLTPIKEEVLTK